MVGLGAQCLLLDTTLTPWPDGQPEYSGAKLAKWDTLSADEKKLFARQAEAFAAYVAYTENKGWTG